MEDIEDEIRVTATVHGLGTPMHSHAAGSSTRSGEVELKGSEKNIREDFSIRSLDRKRRNIKALRNPKNIVWGEVLDLPIRWKDVSRDACIAFNVIGPSGEQVGILFFIVVVLVSSTSDT